MFNLNKTVLLLVTVVSLGASANMNAGTSFSNSELADLSPFSKGVQEQVLKDVLAIMGKVVDPNIELPKILVSEDVDLNDTEVIGALEAQGMPAWALAKGINMYLLSQNVIILGKTQNIHNLAHEFTHYVQVMYQGTTLDEGSFDRLEMEAVSVQGHFRFVDNQLADL